MLFLQGHLHLGLLKNFPTKILYALLDSVVLAGCPDSLTSYPLQSL